MRQRATALVLVVLSVCPITLPFSSCDVTDRSSSQGLEAGAIVQGKPAPDDSLARVAAAPSLFGSAHLTVSPPLGGHRSVHMSGWRQPPLRI